MRPLDKNNTDSTPSRRLTRPFANQILGMKQINNNKDTQYIGEKAFLSFLDENRVQSFTK